MTRSVVTFKQFFLESTEDEVEQYKNLFDELQQSNAEVMFRGLLNSQGVEYAEQYRIDEKRKFLIDFAFPDIKTAIEINGPFHYEIEKRNWGNASKEIIDSTGENNDISKLLARYQNRHDFIKNLGWRIIEIPCTIISEKNELIIKIINHIKTKLSDVPKENKFKYDEYKYKPKRHVRLKSTEESINLLKKLIETKTYREIARDIINKISLNISVSRLSQNISFFCRINGIKEKQDDLFKKILEKINKIMPDIHDRNSLSKEAMAKRLKEEYEINVSGRTLRKWFNDGEIHGWIPYDPTIIYAEIISKINKIMPDIHDCNSLSITAMVKRLKEEYMINVSDNTLTRWFNDGEIHGWIPYDSTITISNINKIMTKIVDRNSLSIRAMVKRLKEEYEINVSRNTLTRWFNDGEIHGWIPYDSTITISNINKIMTKIVDRNSLSKEAMAKRLKEEYEINVSGKTLGKWFNDGEIHGWTPKDNRFKNNI